MVTVNLCVIVFWLHRLVRFVTFVGVASPLNPSVDGVCSATQGTLGRGEFGAFRAPLGRRVHDPHTRGHIPSYEDFMRILVRLESMDVQVVWGLSLDQLSA